MSWVEKERWRDQIRGDIRGGNLYLSDETLNYCFNYVTHGHVDYLKHETSFAEFKDGLLEHFENSANPFDNLAYIDLLKRCESFHRFFRAQEQFKIDGRRVVYK